MAYALPLFILPYVPFFIFNPMADTPAPSEIPVKSKKRFRILLALSIVGIVLLKLSFIFFLIGMMPAMVAYMVDHDKHKYIFSTVTALNFAGVFPEVMDIVAQGSTFNAIKAKLSDALVWFSMYSAAGLGWALVWLSPLLVAIVLEGIYRGRILHMENVQKKLEEEWGKEIDQQQAP
jgi:hypothetical protein